MSEPTVSTARTTPCATHPGVETALRCSKCDKPICPRCLVHTPVGARCRDCAQLRRLPIYRMDPADWARALAVAVGATVVGGVLWAFLAGIGRGWLGFLVAAGVGYGIGEAISAGANRKRVGLLQAVAGLAVVGSFVVAEGVRLLVAGLPLDLGLVAALVVRSLFSIFTLLLLLIGVLVAISRIRR